MISPSKIRNLFSSAPQVLDGKYFLNTHIYLEAYVKRVLLIGLRLKGVQYNNAVKVVESTYLHTSKLIEVALCMIDQSGKTEVNIISDLKSSNPDFFVLKDAVLNFSSIYRNRLAHGTISELNDQEMINWLCHVNLSFVKSFEQVLCNSHSCSAYEKPSDWGAVPGISETIEKTVGRLSLGKIIKKPLSLNEVKSRLAVTAFSKP